MQHKKDNDVQGCLSTYDKLWQRWQEERVTRQQHASRVRTLLQKKGPAIFRRFGIQRVWLFGSVQENRSGKEADVDLLVIPLENSCFWQCKRDLETALLCPVDLYSNKDDPLFVKKIKERGERIYEI